MVFREAFVVLAAAGGGSEAATAGLGATPALGFNNWDLSGCNATMPSAGLMQSVANAFVKFGLKDAGYNYINMDDCWMLTTPGPHGEQIPDPMKFPPSKPDLNDGVKVVAEHIHSLGLKLGIYTAMGHQTCAHHVGSCGAEAANSKQYAAWDVDYLKVDACTPCTNAMNDTAVIRSTLTADTTSPHGTGRPVLMQVHPDLNVSDVSANPAKYGNARRIGHDILGTWFSMLSLVDADSGLWPFAHNDTGLGGFFNDLDIVEIGLPGDFLSDVQRIRTHFSMWVILKAPILLGAPIDQMTATALEIVKDSEVLALHQDSWGRQARRVSSVTPPDGKLSAPFDAQVALTRCESGKSTQKWRHNKTDGTLWTSDDQGRRWCIGPSSIMYTRPLNVLPCDDPHYRYDPKVDCSYPRACNMIASWDVQPHTCLAGYPTPKLCPAPLLGGVAGEGCSLILRCASGEVIKDIEFADWGTVMVNSTTACEYRSNSSCTSLESTKRLVRGLCVGKAECTVNADAYSLGDPCSGTHKRLAVRATGCRPGPPPSPQPPRIEFASTTGAGRLAWQMQPYASGPLPHTVYMMGGRPNNIFYFGDASGAEGTARLEEDGKPIIAAYGNIIDDDHVGGVKLTPATDFCLDAIRGGNLETWVAPLSGDRYAVALLNRSPSSATISVEWSQLGIAVSEAFLVRDVWAKRDMGVFNGSYTASVLGHDTALLVLMPARDVARLGAELASLYV